MFLMVILCPFSATNCGDTPTAARPNRPPHPVDRSGDQSHPNRFWSQRAPNLFARTPGGRLRATNVELAEVLHHVVYIPLRSLWFLQVNDCFLRGHGSITRCTAGDHDQFNAGCLVSDTPSDASVTRMTLYRPCRYPAVETAMATRCATRPPFRPSSNWNAISAES
jgi:hypothetical protein